MNKHSLKGNRDKKKEFYHRRHTVDPAIKEVPVSAMAEQPSMQKPENFINSEKNLLESL